MKNFLVFFTLLGFLPVYAQYYYHDIISTQETSRQMKNYLNNQVKKVSAAGFDPSGSKSPEFDEWQEILEDGTMLKVTTRNGQAVSRVYYRFDTLTRLISATDSAGDVISTTVYNYDGNGRLSRVENRITDAANDFNQAEVHTWLYNTAGLPLGMWRSINNADSIEVRLKADASGNPSEERSFKRNTETSVYYYYYDEQNRLTDIVRYNDRAKRLLPDYMFEYDDNNNVIQKITTTSSIGLGYIIWRYIFNDKGLKTKEALFDKDKQITGRIEYSYSFSQ